MTNAVTKPHRRKKRVARTLCADQIVFGLFSIFCLLLILRNSEAAIAYVTRGLLLCARTVIPSLFPFMVLSELIVAGGFGRALIRRIYTPIKRLFALSEAGCCAFLLGIVCGFPIGARCAVSAYDRGEMSKSECERVLCISGAPSSAFLISAVGASLWESRTFGIALYASVIAASLVTAFVLAQIKKNSAADAPDEFAALSAPTLRGAPLFTHAVRSATEGILSVSAYVIFFSALTGTVELVLSPLSPSSLVLAAITSILELSGGVSQAAALDHASVAAILTAAAAGWSGLSVHCQILSVTDGRALSLRPYFLSKLFQSILAAIFLALLIYIFPALLSSSNTGGL
ncbi:MAG: hypothetical protein IJX80_09265 [Clostridia bacterium]|nr:hypothetical protein [Clostridia bacterium]